MKKSVLITGGAGSIGREFVRLLHTNYRVSVVDNNEWAVAELRSEFPEVMVNLIDFAALAPLTKYDYVLHLAAYKHVNLGEDNTLSFIENNLVKTMEFYRLMDIGKVGKLLYLSTDKAVEPISAYGMTKALAEKLTLDVGGQVARCGNFLHSSGSVIPVWEKQISEKTPLTVTDENMVRYVCEIDEAVKEIWQRFLKGERLIIPTTQTVTVRQLLDMVLQRHGYTDLSKYEPGIKIIGLRPGEKMIEKLRWEHE